MRQHPRTPFRVLPSARCLGARAAADALGVQGHHALMDGLHVGKFYTLIEDFLADPGVPLG